MARIKEGQKVKVSSGANKGIKGVISSIEDSPFYITIKTDSGHFVHGLRKSMLEVIEVVTEPKMARSQFEEEVFAFKEGGGINYVVRGESIEPKYYDFRYDTKAENIVGMYVEQYAPQSVSEAKRLLNQIKSQFAKGSMYANFNPTHAIRYKYQYGHTSGWKIYYTTEEVRERYYDEIGDNRKVYDLVVAHETGGGIEYPESERWWGNDLSINEQKQFAKKHLLSFEYEELMGNTAQYSKPERRKKFINEIWEKEGKPVSKIAGLYKDGGDVETEDVHISRIKGGDTIIHNGEIKTVSFNDIKHSQDMGHTIFGDSYNLGYKKVKRITKRGITQLEDGGEAIEFWKMTQSEFAKMSPKEVLVNGDLYKITQNKRVGCTSVYQHGNYSACDMYVHRQIVQEAIKNGKKVPENVLADYSDLASFKEGGRLEDSEYLQKWENDSVSVLNAIKDGFAETKEGLNIIEIAKKTGISADRVKGIVQSLFSIGSISNQDGQYVLTEKSKFATGGQVLKHKHLKGLTIKLLSPTAKGWKVEQTETHQSWGDKKLRTPHVKTAFFSNEELKDLFEEKFDDGGRLVIFKVSAGGLIMVGDFAMVNDESSSYYRQTGQVERLMPDGNTVELKFKHKVGNDFAKFDKSYLVYVDHVSVRHLLKDGGELSFSAAEQKNWSTEKSRMYDAYANAHNKIEDLKLELVKAESRNDNEEIKSIKNKIAQNKLAKKTAKEKFFEYKDGGVITSARITQMPKAIGDEMPKVYATIDGKEEFLFEYYPDEISFTPEEFVGLTIDQAKHLKFVKDKEFLQSDEFGKGGYTRENRPSPSESATWYSEGTVKEGNDGNMWEIRIAGEKKIHRWVKVGSGHSEKKAEPVEPVKEIVYEDDYVVLVVGKGEIYEGDDLKKAKSMFHAYADSHSDKAVKLLDKYGEVIIQSEAVVFAKGGAVPVDTPIKTNVMIVPQPDFTSSDMFGDQNKFVQLMSEKGFINVIVRHNTKTSYRVKLYLEPFMFGIDSHKADGIKYHEKEESNIWSGTRYMAYYIKTTFLRDLVVHVEANLTHFFPNLDLKNFTLKFHNTGALKEFDRTGVKLVTEQPKPLPEEEGSIPVPEFELEGTWSENGNTWYRIKFSAGGERLFLFNTGDSDSATFDEDDILNIAKNKGIITEEERVNASIERISKEEFNKLHTEMVKLSSVTLLYSEADYKDDLPKEFPDFVSLSNYIKENIGKILLPAGYHKHGVKAVWKDGEDWTERIDISKKENNPNKYINIIGHYIADITLFYIGLAEKNCSDSMISAEEYKKRATNYVEFIKGYDFQIFREDFSLALFERMKDFSAEGFIPKRFKIAPYSSEEYLVMVKKWISLEFMDSLPNPAPKDVDLYEDIQVIVVGKGAIHEGTSYKKAKAMFDAYVDINPEKHVVILDNVTGKTLVEFKDGKESILFDDGGTTEPDEDEMYDILAEESKQDLRFVFENGGKMC